MKLITINYLISSSKAYQNYERKKAVCWKPKSILNYSLRLQLYDITVLSVYVSRTRNNKNDPKTYNFVDFFKSPT